MKQIHLILGYSGLIPFIGLSALTIYGWQPAQFLLLSYAALILSFLGGVVWMATIQAEKHWLIAVASNLAMLLAWLAVIFRNNPFSLPGVAALMLGLLWLESEYLQEQYTKAFFILRKHLTFIAALSILCADFFA
jgi:hypothetical protein